MSQTLPISDFQFSVLVTDWKNHCVHAININQTGPVTRAPFTGTCGHPGHTNDETFQRTLLRYPSSSIYIPSTSYGRVFIYSPQVADKTGLANLNICDLTGDGVCLLYWLTLDGTMAKEIVQAYYRYDVYTPTGYSQFFSYDDEYCCYCRCDDYHCYSYVVDVGTVFGAVAITNSLFIVYISILHV